MRDMKKRVMGIVFAAAGLLAGLSGGASFSPSGPAAQAAIRATDDYDRCDRDGAIAKCWDCGSEGCVKICVGASECTEYNGTDGASCVAQGSCASGSFQWRPLRK